MILEIAQIDVKPGMEAEFEAGVAKATPLFKPREGLSRHGVAALGRKAVALPVVRTVGDGGEPHGRFPRFRRLPGMAQAGGRLLRLAARGGTRAQRCERLLSRPFPAMLAGPYSHHGEISRQATEPKRIRRSIPRRTRRKPTRAKAARPDLPPIEPALAQLLNPGIGQGTAGPGSQTGLQPPPDNSFDRRRDFSDAHRARKSTTEGFEEAPQSGYAAKGIAPPDIHKGLAETLGYKEDEISGQRVVRRHRDRAGAGIAAARGPAGIRRAAVDAASAAAAGEIRGRPSPRHQVRVRAEGRSAAGDPRSGRGRQASRPHAGAARRHRLGQDLHDGEGDRGDAASRAGARTQQDAGRAALRRVQIVLSRQRGRVFRLATTTTTSRRPTSRAPTPTSRRNPRSTSRSTACATRRRARCSNATTSSSWRRCRASTVSARSKPIRR